MGQEGYREYESDQLTSLCHKLKEDRGKELKYTEGASKGKKYREKIHDEILSHMAWIKLLCVWISSELALIIMKLKVRLYILSSA